MKVYALSGGIASGKSSIAKIFKKLGVPVIDADLVVHRLYKKGNPVYKKVVELCGQSILNRSLEINRKKLGALVFNDEKLRKELETIVHPATRQKISDELAKLEKKGTEIALVEAALMVESKYYKEFDALIMVYVDEKTQQQRLMERDKISSSSALKIIESQLPLSKKKKFAKYLIDNSGTLKEAKKQVQELLLKL